MPTQPPSGENPYAGQSYPPAPFGQASYPERPSPQHLQPPQPPQPPQAPPVAPQDPQAPYAQVPQAESPYGYGAPVPPPPPAPGYAASAPAYAPAYVASAPAYAHWGKRVVATIIDGLIPMVMYGIAFVVLLTSAVHNTETVVLNDGYAYKVHGGAGGGALAVFGILAIAAFVFAFYNMVFRQGRTGSSIGKGIMGIRVVREADGQPVGAGMSFLRMFAHLLDGWSFYIGYLWPLWDAKRQTFADKILHHVVVEQPKR